MSVCPSLVPASVKEINDQARELVLSLYPSFMTRGKPSLTHVSHLVSHLVH